MAPFSANDDNDDWNTSTRSSLVSIGTHRLYASISGPPRKDNDPLVVIIPGAGESSSSYPAVQRLVASFARILLYDRSGLGRSEDHPPKSNNNPNQPTATAVTAAEELHALLTTLRLAPPYILIAHSYGAIVAREFLHLHPASVAGMVLADPSSERQHHYFRIPDPNITAVLGHLNFARVTGLRDDAKLSRDEWRLRAADISRGAATPSSAGQVEAASFVEVCETLAAKNQLTHHPLGADKPLSIICCRSVRDYERIYTAGVEAGNGTAKERRAFRELLDRWDEADRGLKGEMLGLVSEEGRKRRLVNVEDCGHFVHLVRPDLVAGEVRWVIVEGVGGGNLTGRI
ncbi:hypothetical protein VTN00DRAFT_4739 [Thermoascus crustaceus]|uniref:uncharacterized protein n=1 Tax=Thermoascus crustaceus TaxID=5088 RepID=UPI003743B171